MKLRLPRVINERAVTMVELLVATGLMGIVSIFVGLLVRESTMFYHHYESRSRADQDARTSLDRLQKMLSNAPASTISIRTTDCIVRNCNLFNPAVNQAPPNSEIVFSTSTNIGTGIYDIYWLAQKDLPNTLHMTTTLNPGAPDQKQADQVLATYVKAITFSWNYSDPALLDVSLQVNAPLSPSRDATGHMLETYDLSLTRTIRVLKQ